MRATKLEWVFTLIWLGVFLAIETIEARLAFSVVSFVAVCAFYSWQERREKRKQ